VSDPQSWAEFGAEPGLFDVEQPPPVSLADKFGIPPMALIDRRADDWQQRKRRWLSMGIKSEEGRGGDLLGLQHIIDNPEQYRRYETLTGTSVFDPVICELVYRWFTLPGWRVLDPFAGGSVRGVVAATLGRGYFGVDLRPEQVQANRDQWPGIAARYSPPGPEPRWYPGDAADVVGRLAAASYDLVFTCPPYADLEQYSDDPRDLSNMDYPAFVAAQALIIGRACARLRPDRFACWVTSDVRDKQGGYRGLRDATVAAFRAAGLTLWNDVIILDRYGTLPIRVERYFRATRKLGRVHQHLLIFCKGDARAATQLLEEGV
jgi:DNA modification methylase